VVAVAEWVALLRGVNVNGITMTSADLKALFADLGSPRPRTVLASGNVVFQAPDDEALPRVKQRVEAGLRERFGYDAWVVLLTPARLAEVAAGYPFPRQDAALHPYVVFSSDAAVLASLAERAQGLPAWEGERVQPAGDVLYWQVPRGSSTDTPVAKLLGAAANKPHVTTRNLRTVEKVLAVTGG
jgi:uncharacterized protein (DUF1697 family)